MYGYIFAMSQDQTIRVTENISDIEYDIFPTGILELSDNIGVFRWNTVPLYWSFPAIYGAFRWYDVSNIEVFQQNWNFPMEYHS